MKSPCDQLAGPPPHVVPPLGGSPSDPHSTRAREDARLIAAREELRRFVTDITQLVDTRLTELIERIASNEAAVDALFDSNRLRSIARSVAKEFDLKVDVFYSLDRHKIIAVPRQVAMYLAREFTDASLHHIGAHFGGRDHGTVLHAVKATRIRMAKSPRFKRAVESIAKSLRDRLQPCPPPEQRLKLPNLQ